MEIYVKKYPKIGRLYTGCPTAAAFVVQQAKQPLRGMELQEKEPQKKFKA